VTFSLTLPSPCTSRSGTTIKRENMSGTDQLMSRSNVYTTSWGQLGALMMAKIEHTSAKAGKAASNVLRDGRTGKDSKTAAASALSQRLDKK